MEEMNKEIMENGMTEVVEAASDKLTFGETCMSYGLATVFGIGVVTVGYLGFKGVKGLVKKVRNKKKDQKEAEEEAVVDVEEDEIHEVQENDNSEEN